MERVKQTLGLKSERQARLVVLLVSTMIIVVSSLFAYNRITYEFPLAVGNTGQSALGPPTSAGVGIAYAMVVVAAILGFGAILSIFGSLRNVSNRITDVVRESLPLGSKPAPEQKDEWEQASIENPRKATDNEILNALLRSKEKKPSSEESPQ